MAEAADTLRYDVVILSANFHIGRFQTGAGYRCLELALSLHDLGTRVAIVAPGATDFDDLPVDVLDRETLTPDDILACARVFLFCLREDPDLIEFLAGHDRSLIYDSYLSPVEQLTFASVVRMEDDQQKENYFHGVIRTHTRFNELACSYLVGEPQEKLLKLGELINTFQVRPADHVSLGDTILPLPVVSYHRRSLPTGSLEPTGDTFLWNGGLYNHYDGVDLLIDAVTALRESGRDVRFRFLYPGEHTLAHQRIVRRKTDEHLPYVELGAPPDFSAKAAILASCRALVLTYGSVLQMHLFLSMRMREMLVYEKPMIVSRPGAIGAFVEEHGVGLVVDNTVGAVRDAMERLVVDASLYDALRDNIRRLKKRYDMANFVPPIARLITVANAG
ncbi:glycosyltransferase [Cryptosporangium arvum]|uniref:Glycosyltransferase n=1 Tax=Cryptosporangium arvum DSM 44712 TaxID=927661 RepID=A0A010ZV90_9ACTN|nr:glycosyltransferase [Cryptosporangium arvum]EXG82614.1 hypothetical protein CryarDRAFT_3809 [Cryptosporangium arvum DSM 44712]